ncbi:hypothetical protein CCACVL1_05713 [Corchorus capsularis]|uniref:Uncharacterized protein n=1 Tax=Corchorus capsularis TaxID=210143 RepID=A0A1R3JJ76_COCAP|nr:hypothetical protein CCACVL1_05713 [Corchorus capsularis]
MDGKSAAAFHRKLVFSPKDLENAELKGENDSVSIEEAAGLNQRAEVVVKPKDSEKSVHGMKQNRAIMTSLVGVPIEKQQDVSVSERRRKNNDERTGFFSDYSRPRTRPPSHN